MSSSEDKETPSPVPPKVKGTSAKGRSTKGRSLQSFKIKPKPKKKEPKDKEKDFVEIGKEHTTTILIYVFLT